MKAQRLTPHRADPQRARERGFTAVEITAVATIIAVMALILIPVVRNRVEEARRVAAMDDMAGIEKAQSLAFGYTNFYYRLMDLPRQESATGPGIQPAAEALKPPKGSWTQPFTTGQQGGINSTWKGSFVSYHNTRPLTELVPLFPHVFRSSTQDPPGYNLGQLRGPVLLFGSDQIDQFGTDAVTAGRVRYPVDPWGAPYIFFGAGRVGIDGDPAVAITNQTEWGNSAVYTMGPDGEPSSNQNNFNVPGAYFREAFQLGADGSDDQKREF